MASTIKKRLALRLRELDLAKQSMMNLGAWCQALGQSGRGNKQELIDTLEKHIWSTEYNEQKI